MNEIGDPLMESSRRNIDDFTFALLFHLRVYSLAA
jgi:hypothetical protein